MTTTEAVETRQYLLFDLAAETYALDVEKVNEVLEMMPISRLPKTPAFMRGVINVRGSVVPVVDLRSRFGLPERDSAADACIIVTEPGGQSGVSRIGLIADDAKEVVRFADGDIQPAPRIGSFIANNFIAGMGRHQGDFVMIIDIDKVFAAGEPAASDAGSA